MGRGGGIGIKKFSPMNQALLAKQYWRLINSPQSLLARTFKAKYHPNESLQDHTPKAHHSWVWKNIVPQGDPLLREGKWLVGDGFDIPLTHPDWSPNLRDSSLLPFLQTGTIGDLINHNSRSWKVDLIRRLYHHPKAVNILQMHISKINDSKDRLMWKYSRDGNYSTKRAYELLTEDSLGSQKFQQEMKIWIAIWKAHVPLRITNFVWELLHDSLPTMTTLHSKGISNDDICPLCNAEEETPTHLFLFGSFSRACWFGSDLGLHTSDITNVSVQS